jgi:N-acetylmuramoyl-L-alanine amidase
MRQLFVDAGHSAKFPGAKGVVDEWVRNTQLVAWFKEYAQKIGWTLVSVPDKFPSDVLRSSNLNLLERIRWVNKRCKDGDWLLSIHSNASTNPSANGITTVYMGGSEYMRSRASLLSNRVAETSGLEVNSTGAFDDRNGRFGRVGMVRDTIPPALLIEAGFVTNGKDMAVPLVDIARAMADFFEDLNGGWYKDLKI